MAFVNRVIIFVLRKDRPPLYRKENTVWLMCNVDEPISDDDTKLAAQELPAILKQYQSEHPEYADWIVEARLMFNLSSVWGT